MIQGLNHVTIVGTDRDATLAFYVGLLGLREGWRPDSDIPGAWLYADGPGAVLHIVWDRAADAARPGVIDHVAFSARDLPAIQARLQAAQVPMDLRPPLPGAPLQMFLHDPNGVRVELCFDPAEMT
jgi:catechol 2,3-dioxygenase-like lactoylglutathione lyase family enzyme